MSDSHAPSPAAPPSPWTDRPLPSPGAPVHHDVGPLCFWMRTVENEVWIGHQPLDPTLPPEERHVPDDLEWHRWALRPGTTALRFRPALPDRLLVVKTEHPFTLQSGADARIYMRVGAWVRVSAVARDGHESTLMEIPTERLSDTWWGDFVSGELGYFVTTKARRGLSDDLFEPHRIMCTLQLHNRSPDDLPVEKLALRVEHLSVFRAGARLWAEETIVEYRGEDEGSDIRMEDRAPAEAAGSEEITPARTASRGFRARTFARLKALSPFGFSG